MDFGAVFLKEHPLHAPFFCNHTHQQHHGIDSKKNDTHVHITVLECHTHHQCIKVARGRNSVEISNDADDSDTADY